MNKKYLSIGCIIALVFGTVFYKANANVSPDGNKTIVKDINETQNKIMQEEADTKELKREQYRLKAILEDRNAEDFPIITYNHIYKEDEEDLYYNKISKNNISEKQFKEQMNYLKENNYYVATLEELYKFKNDELDLPKKTVLIIFENGYKSLLDIAYPILKEYNFYASVFIPGNELRKYDKKNFANRIDFLDYDDLKDISDIVSIESKTYNLYGLEDRESKFKLADEDIVAKDLDLNIESLGSNFFLFPNEGDEEYHNLILEKKGFKLGLSHKEGRVTKDIDNYKIPRYIINKNTTLEDFKDIVKIEK